MTRKIIPASKSDTPAFRASIAADVSIAAAIIFAQLGFVAFAARTPSAARLRKMNSGSDNANV